MATRRAFILGGSASLAVAACGRRTDAELDFAEKAAALIAARPSLDLHAHPGRTFIRGGENLAPAIAAFAAGGAFEDRCIADLRAAGMTAVVFCAVSDFQVLDFVNGVPTARRQFAPGEALASYRRQIGNLKRLVADGLAQQILRPVDVGDVKREGDLGLIIGVEGGDFLEGSAERVAEAHADGVRCINPVHYHSNEIGDIMTASPLHSGLTEVGVNVIRAMNKAGIIIDIAHASEPTAFGMLKTSDKPVICSHTHIRTANFDSPRFIGLDLAREVAAGGGVIGAWPAGIGISDLNGFVDRIFELVDAVGVDHVGLGSDMDANYNPVWDNYRQFPEIIAKVLERGLDGVDVQKIIGGNGMRVFNAVCA